MIGVNTGRCGHLHLGHLDHGRGGQTYSKALSKVFFIIKFPLSPSSVICPPSQDCRRDMSVKTLSNALPRVLLPCSASSLGGGHQDCPFPKIGCGNGLSIPLPPNKGVQCYVLGVIIAPSNYEIAFLRDDGLGWAEAKVVFLCQTPRCGGPDCDLSWS